MSRSKVLPTKWRRGDSERGSILVLSIIMLVLMSALATAFFTVSLKNSRQSVFFNDNGELMRYAESGIHMALYEFNFGVGGGDGKIGTEAWTTADDLGRDGVAMTGDEGEGDGLPTPGEPNLAAVPIGPAASRMDLLVYAAASAWPGVTRIVATATKGENISSFETYITPRNTTVGASYVPEGTDLQFSGASFKISGADLNPDGTPGPEATTYAVSTTPGDPPGSNSDALKTEIAPGNWAQVTGAGGSPSVGEVATVDFDALFDEFKNARGVVVKPPGSYANFSWGNWTTNNYQITYVNGNLSFSGLWKGAGVLVVDGDLDMSGQSTFVGLVLVRGKVSVSGGGVGIHIYGSLLVNDSPATTVFKATGTADLTYSSFGLEKAFGLVGQKFATLYWNRLQ